MITTPWAVIIFAVIVVAVLFALDTPEKEVCKPKEKKVMTDMIKDKSGKTKIVTRDSKGHFVKAKKTVKK